MGLVWKKKPLRYWLNLLAAGVVFTVIVYLLMLSVTLILPARVEVGAPPPELGAEVETVSIPLEDGVSLKGWFIPAKNGKAAVLLHGYGGNRTGMLWHARTLAQAGYGVLLYDQRASGESGGKWRTWGWQDAADLQDTLAFLESRYGLPASRVSLVGASTGAEIAILALERHPELNAVVADGPGYSTVADLPPQMSLGDRMVTAPVGLVLKLVEWETGVKPESSIIRAMQKVDARKVLLISTGSGPEKAIGDHYCAILGAECNSWNVPQAAHTLAYRILPEEYTRRMLQVLGE